MSKAASSVEAFERASRVADAVLYEGYVLYPYRASSAKNQMRWQFGVVAPRPFAEADGIEQWFQQTEVIAEFGVDAQIDVRVRFLQVQTRTVQAAEGDDLVPVEHLDVDGVRWATWEEAVEQVVDVTGIDLASVGTHETAFTFPAFREIEGLGPAGRVVRERWELNGVVRIAIEDVPGPYPLSRLQVRVENITDWAESGARREAAVRRSLVGVHVLAHVDDGSFLSSFDPPEFARGAVESCTNRIAFPVLIGDEDDDTTFLSSPIILYDRPEVAAESPGDMCDATEIDEILALRVLTLTDDEKMQARATDPRAAAIVDRVDDFAPEMFEQLHGAIRSLRPAVEEPLPWWEPAVDAAVDPWTDTLCIDDVTVMKGSKVRLRPGARRTDAQDLFLVGRIATVEGVFSDVDGDQHLAVTLDDDPAAELHQWHGRFLYFHPDEAEPVR
ncbi:MAG: hypothetical protein M3Z46_09005 [Actinomycetota bacterium]|nr:hypothetical protein [Actinomycetota bacterium]